MFSSRVSLDAASIVCGVFRNGLVLVRSQIVARSLLSHFVLWHSKHTAFASRSSAHQSHERWTCRWRSAMVADNQLSGACYIDRGPVIIHCIPIAGTCWTCKCRGAASFCTRGVLFIFVPHLEGRLPSATSSNLCNHWFFFAVLWAWWSPLWFRRTSASGSLQNEPASLPHVLFLCCVGCNAWFRRVCCDARHESINNSW